MSIGANDAITTNNDDGALRNESLTPSSPSSSSSSSSLSTTATTQTITVPTMTTTATTMAMTTTTTTMMMIDGMTNNAAISEEEFCRLQHQLLELRNRNYELLEENKRQQNYINAQLSNKGTEALLFATKFVGRRKDKENMNEKLENEIRLLQHKLSSQEEEFRLQQSTLLSELNKVVKQCELLESERKEYNAGNDELPVQSKGDMEKLMKKNSDLEMEISSLKEVLSEKDLLVAEIKKLNQDLLSAKKVLDEQINVEQRRSASFRDDLEEATRKLSECGVLLNVKENELATLRESYMKLMEKASTSDKLSQTDNSQDIDGLQEYVRKLEAECEKLREIEEIAIAKDASLKEGQKLLNSLETELQTAKAMVSAAKEEKIAEEAAWEETRQELYAELQILNLQMQELQRSNEEQSSAVLNFEMIKAALEAKIKEGEEEVKRKDEEMKVALKKQSSMVKELRRQVQAEKKRAEQAEKHLDDVLGMSDANVCSQHGARTRFGGSPLTLSDRCKVKNDAEAASSICSWAFVVEPDKNSLHNFDGEESSCSASILEADNAELIGRLAVLQKKHAETIDRLNVIEEENALLRKEVDEKSEVIARWIRSLPDISHSSQVGASSPGLRFRRMLEMVRMDESAADIRDMNRRLQRMLEETLSKNLILQKNIQTLLEKSDK